MLDKVTIQRIGQLHPLLRNEALHIYEEIAIALGDSSTCRFTQTLRTIAEQDAFYAQGRTKPGNIITNARGGLSYHNYGLAIDFAFIKGNALSYDMNADWDKDQKKDWYEVVSIFKTFGWEWGGDWATFKDYPHFQKTFGYTVRQLFDMYKQNKLDKNGYVLIKQSVC